MGRRAAVPEGAQRLICKDSKYMHIAVDKIRHMIIGLTKGLQCNALLFVRMQLEYNAH